MKQSDSDKMLGNVLQIHIITWIENSSEGSTGLIQRGFNIISKRSADRFYVKFISNIIWYVRLFAIAGHGSSDETENREKHSESERQPGKYAICVLGGHNFPEKVGKSLKIALKVR